jgi:Ser/Thr protein kinase RdoA (MazF antagonist)
MRTGVLTNPWGSKATQHFFALTPGHILDAVERAGFHCTGRCLALNSMENRVYEVEIEVDDPRALRSPSDRFVIVKFYRPGRWSWDQIQDEHDFLFDLVDADIPVVAPKQRDDGHSIFEDEHLGLMYTLFPKIGGRSPDELDDESCQRVGRLLARMHGIGAIKPADHRIRLSTESYGVSNLKWLIDSGSIPVDIRSRYQKAVESICDMTAPWFAAARLQRIHGDCHLGNLLWGANGPFWVDFDDMVMGPPVQDLWLMIPGRDDEAQRKLNLTIAAYETMRPFDRETLRLIEPLRALRFVHFAAWIGRRWEDPSFSRAFPQFGSSRWWGEQLLDMEEQQLIIRESSGKH